LVEPIRLREQFPNFLEPNHVSDLPSRAPALAGIEAETHGVVLLLYHPEKQPRVCAMLAEFGGIKGQRWTFCVQLMWRGLHETNRE
jgi:hypothetical protein